MKVPATKGSAVRSVSISKTGKPWLNLPIAANRRRASTSPPASNAIRLTYHRRKLNLISNIQNLEIIQILEARAYPHLSTREEAPGFSNWMTPSRGTLSWPTSSGPQPSKERGRGGEDAVCLAAGAEESTASSALARVRTRGLLEEGPPTPPLGETNLGRRLEKREGLGAAEVVEEQHLVDDRALPEGAWPSTSIFLGCLLSPWLCPVRFFSHLVELIHGNPTKHILEPETFVQAQSSSPSPAHYPTNLDPVTL